MSRRRVASLGAALALACGACSLILDFDKPPDAGPADAPVDDTACMAFEPNDTPADAEAISPGTYAAAICGGGETDYFRFSVDGAQTVTARIEFMNRNGAGDIDLRLLSVDGATTIAESRTSNDFEMVMCPGGVLCTAPLPAGDYLLQVLGFNAAVQASYTLTLTVTAARPAAD